MNPFGSILRQRHLVAWQHPNLVRRSPAFAVPLAVSEWGPRPPCALGHVFGISVQRDHFVAQVAAPVISADTIASFALASFSFPALRAPGRVFPG